MTDSNPVHSWDEIRAMLDMKIQVYEVKDAEVTRKREKAKKDTIDWVISEMKHGIDLDHTMKQVPECTWTFGNEWAYVQKAMTMRYPNCQICGRPTQEIHHIRPRFLKGQNTPSNLIALCMECHDEVHRRLDESINQAIRDSIGQVADKMKKRTTLEQFKEEVL